MCSLFADGMRSQWTGGHFARRYISFFFFIRRHSYFIHSACYLHAMDISRFFFSVVSYSLCHSATPTSTAASAFSLVRWLFFFLYFVECFVWRESYLHIYVCFSMSGFQQRDGYRHHRFNNTRDPTRASMGSHLVVRRWLVSKLKCKQKQKRNELLHFIISIAPLHRFICNYWTRSFYDNLPVIYCRLSCHPSRSTNGNTAHRLLFASINRIESQSKMKPKND